MMLPGGDNIVITEGDRIVKSDPVKWFKKYMENEFGDGDYIERGAVRLLAFDVPLHIQELHQESLGFSVSKKTPMTHDQEAEPSSRYDEQEPGIQTKVEHGNGASSMIGHFSHSYRKKTLNELDEGFRAIRGPWNKSDECKALVTQIRRLAATRKQQPLFQNIVALGIGSFHLSHQKEIPRRSGFQLAAILTIRDTMSEESDKPMTCTVQDPAYSELEKDYLRSLDLEVVDDPDAYSRIDATSLVFHLGGYFDFAWWIAEGVWPAVMITSDWGNPRPALVRHNPAYFVTFVHYMFRHYDCEPLAGDCDGDGSADGDVIREGSTNIYRRKHSTFALSLDQHILDTAA